MKQILIILSLLATFAINATAQKIKTEYTFIKHDTIPMNLPDTVITFSGAKIATGKLTPDNNLYYEAALTPYYPLTTTFTDNRQLPPEERNCFRINKGIIPYCINYKTIVNGDTIVIDTHEKFRQLFAPIESIPEAIAFAHIFTGSKPMYNLDFLNPLQPEYEQISPVPVGHNRLQLYRRLLDEDKMWNVYQPEIISSYCRETEDGYELLLYNYTVFGCSHPYIRQLIKVTFGGVVEVVEKYKAFEKLSDIGFCVD